MHQPPRIHGPVAAAFAYPPAAGPQGVPNHGAHQMGPSIGVMAMPTRAREASALGLMVRPLPRKASFY